VETIASTFMGDPMSERDARARLFGLLGILSLRMALSHLGAAKESPHGWFFVEGGLTVGSPVM